MNGKYFNHLRFADDIVSISQDLDELAEIIKKSDRESRKAGAEVDFEKTKIVMGKRTKVKK